MADSPKKFSQDFNKPDETRRFKNHGHLEVITFEDGTEVGRGVFEPGWRWSYDVKPLAGTHSCEVSHSGYCLKGSMIVRMNNGEEFTIKAGEAYYIPPGHDAWVENKDGCELIDFTGAKTYAIPRKEAA